MRLERASSPIEKPGRWRSLAAVLVAGATIGAVLLWLGRPSRPRRVDLGRPAAWPAGFVANLPWVAYGMDFGAVPAWGPRGVSRRPAAYEAHLRALKDGGIRTIAWFLLADGRSAPRFDAGGTPLELGGDFWADYDAALAIAAKLDLDVVWVVLDQLWMLPPQLVGGSGPIVQLGGRAATLEDAARRKALVDRVLRPLLQHRPRDRIAGWILINEPDNPMARGLVSRVAFAAFVREAVALRQEVAPEQRLAVAFNDLESMAVMASDGALRGLDFLVFHHYARELPPPVGYLRGVLDIGSVPVYVGEFDVRLAGDPSSLRSFVRWTHALGYDGVWPWSLNALREQAESPLAGLAHARMTLDAVASVSDAREARAEFGERRTRAVAALQKGGLDWHRWLADGGALLERETRAQAALAARRQELREELAKLEAVVRDQDRQLTVDVPRCFSQNRAWRQRAPAAERARAEDAVRGCERYQHESALWKAGAETRLAEVRGLFIDLERREWRAKLYVPFWQEELAWAKQIGLPLVQREP